MITCKQWGSLEYWPKKVTPHLFKIQVEQARSFFFGGVYGKLDDQKLVVILCTIIYFQGLSFKQFPPFQLYVKIIAWLILFLTTHCRYVLRQISSDETYYWFPNVTAPRSATKHLKKYYGSIPPGLVDQLEKGYALDFELFDFTKGLSKRLNSSKLT